MISGTHELLAQLVARLATLPQVEAVGLGGSRAAGVGGGDSDFDLYVYTKNNIPLADRLAIQSALGAATRADMGLDHWGPGDMWIYAATGAELDLIYFGSDWMAGELRRVLVDCRPATGYTTAFAHTIAATRTLHDPSGWLAAQQALCAQPYPEALRRAIIAHNHPILRDALPAYARQIDKAIGRGDAVSVNHRVAGLLASYFDIVFAFNRVYHPGEKRLLACAEALCPSRPAALREDVAAVLAHAGRADPALSDHLARLLDRLDAWLATDL